MSEEMNQYQRAKEIEREMFEQGWDYVGTVALKATRFSDGLFREVQVKTIDEAIEERKRELKETAKKDQNVDIEVEVKLIPFPRDLYDGIEIPDKFDRQLVFARVVK